MKTNANKRIWMAVSTIAIIAVLFTYYILVYVPANERELSAKKYRTLQQVGQNFNNRKMAYETSILQAWEEFSKKTVNCSSESEGEMKTRKSEFLALDSQINAFYDKGFDTETDFAKMQRAIEKLERKRDKLSEEILKYEGSCTSQADIIFKTRLKPIRAIKVRSWMDESDRGDTLIMDERINNSQDVIFSGRKYFSNYKPQGKLDFLNMPQDPRTYNFQVKVSEVVGSSAKIITSQFDKFLLIRIFHGTRSDKEPKSSDPYDFLTDESNTAGNNSSGKCCDEEKSKEDSVTTVIAFQGINNIAKPGSENKVVLTDIKKLFQKDQAISSIPVQSIDLSGTTYKVFSHVIEYSHDEDWVLCGMVKQSSFSAEAKRVQLIMIIFLVLILIFILLAMPILKLLIMSSIERLQITNVWFTGFCIVFGTTIFLLFLLTANHYLSYEKDYHTNLQKLSNQVTENFNNEMNAIVRQLRKYDTLGSQLRAIKPVGDSNFVQIGHLLRDRPQYILAHDTAKTNALSKALKERTGDYKYFNETMWLNAKGDQVVRLATHSVSDRHTALNIQHRDYFRNALSNDLYPLYENETDTTPELFCWQSIYSWYNLTPEIGVSVRTVNKDQSLKVLSMATRLNSVMDPLLPPGYEFCIINGSGDVLFHSDKDKNLQENFFSEITQDRGIRSAVAGRNTVFKSIDYNSKNYLAYVRPFRHQPYYLVTMFDREYYKTPIVLTFGFAFVMMMVLFVVQGIQVVIMFAARYQFTKLRIKRFFMAWLRPHMDLHDAFADHERDPCAIPYKQGYIRAIAGMMIVGVMYVSLLFFVFTRQYLIMAMITLPVILLTFHYLVFGDREICRPTFSKMISNKFVMGSAVLLILINILGIQYFTTENIIIQIVLQMAVVLILAFCMYAPFDSFFKQKKRAEAGFSNLMQRKAFSIGIISFVFIVNALVLNYASGYRLPMIALTGTIIVVALWMYSPIQKYFIFPGQLRNDWLHYVFLCTWLTLVSVLPVAYFYKVAFVRETTVWARYVQWKAFQDKNDREARIIQALDKLAFFENTEEARNDRMQYVDDTYTYGNYLSCNEEFQPKDTTRNYDQATKWAIDSLEFQLRPVYFGPMEDSRLGLFSGTHDKFWKWGTGADDHLLMDVDKKMASFTYVSRLPSYLLFKEGYSLLFLIVFLIIMGLIFRVILIANRSIFGLKLQDQRPTDALNIREASDQTVTTEITAQINNSIDIKSKSLIDVITSGDMKLIFLVGLPYSGKSQILSRVVSHFSSRVVELSMRTMTNPQLSDKSKDIRVIHNFEHCINDHIANRKKSKLLIQLLEEPDNIVVVSSTIQPTIILDIYETRIENLENQKKKAEDQAAVNQELADLRNSYRIWKNILSGFKIIYVPLEQWKSQNRLEHELHYGIYLPSIKKAFGTEKVLTEEMVMEIEETAELYYHSLWNSFSQDEKHLLFDLAKDRFVNTTDTKMIRLLIKKGVVVLGDTPCIMNKSFNNFILAAVKEDEEMFMTNELRRRGSWHNVQLILIITLISIAVFIGFVQQELLTHFNALVASVGAVLTLLLRFGGFFGGLKAKE